MLQRNWFEKLINFGGKKLYKSTDFFDNFDFSKHSSECSDCDCMLVR
jgi:hypothetical protein